MYLNRGRKPEARSRQRMFHGRTGFVLISVFCILVSACGVRYDMQDMPRYKVYKKSEFFNDGRASRDLPEGTVARGLLKDNKALYTGKVDNPDPNAQAQTSLNAAGNTVMTTFPNMIDEFPVPVTRELIDRGQERYNIYCIVCHGPTGNGDGMIVRRGFIAPPTYHDDRLRNAPVGHFFDVMTNGFGRMNSYAAQVPAHDRWAIVAYIRALQVSQNPSPAASTSAPSASTAAPAQQSTPNANTPGGGH